MNVELIKKVAIYPAIGIARIGNSSEFFLASDVPGCPPIAAGGYKDGDMKFKKQVPLFRVYGLDENDKVLGEITADTGNIEWRVHIANRKAAWYQFNNALDLDDKSIPSSRRNGGVALSDRSRLVIDPGVRTISGKDKSGAAYQFENGKFFEKEVWLGEIRTDSSGRLMVFSGNGTSASNNGMRAITFANNDGWHDDTSDGTVRATVTIRNVEIEAEPAVVICTPPNFGPGLFSLITMFDVVQDLYIREGRENKVEKIVFWEHIYPLLKRMSDVQWVNEGFFMLFGHNSTSDFTNSSYLSKLSNPDNSCNQERIKVFKWFRDVSSTVYAADKIPPHYGDLFGDYEKMPLVDLAVTSTQYELLSRWAEGDFIEGKLKPIPDFQDMTPQQQVRALLQAPLEECLGGPFHPGIEITWPFRNIQMWSEENYRLKLIPEGEPVIDDYGPIITSKLALMAGGPIDGSGPGTLTRWLGVPWQTDGASCLSGYDTTLYLPLPSFWAARVPNQILSKKAYDRAADKESNMAQRLKHFNYRVDWLRDFSPSYVGRINQMIASWHNLGVITKLHNDLCHESIPEDCWIETDKTEAQGSDPSYQQVLYSERNTISTPADEVPTTYALLNEVSINLQPRESLPLKRHEL